MMREGLSANNPPSPNPCAWDDTQSTESHWPGLYFFLVSAMTKSPLELKPTLYFFLTMVISWLYIFVCVYMYIRRHIICVYIIGLPH